MKNHPLVNQAQRAYRNSAVCSLDKLLAEETRWKRKATIASNKLAAVRRRINLLAGDLTKAKYLAMEWRAPGDSDKATLKGGSDHAS